MSPQTPTSCHLTDHHAIVAVRIGEGTANRYLSAQTIVSQVAQQLSVTPGLLLLMDVQVSRRVGNCEIKRPTFPPSRTRVHTRSSARIFLIAGGGGCQNSHSYRPTH